MWYKFTKTFQGGQKHDYHFLKEGEDIVEQCDKWGEYSDGGHNYGYSLSYDKTDPPPEEWIRKQITHTNVVIGGLKRSIKEKKKYLEFLTNLL